MKHLVAGTAGHIDHGKTVLVRALTGIDTDRLPEEKRRGISIELGYAYLDLPDGTRIGIVDVPGHERFVRTMVAGASGVDFALLVVAADDSVMPQTREHLAILDLLKVRDGLVAVTKADLVDEELLELVVEEVREAVAGTFLARARIVPVSAVTGRGLDELKDAIAEVAARVEERPVGPLARIPIDRVFAKPGHGAVITGTVVNGMLRVGDEVEILPAGLKARVRGLQWHGTPVEVVRAGQRAAVNLAGVKHDELARGQMVCTPEAFLPTMMLDAWVTLQPDVARPLDHGASVSFHHGTTEAKARMALLDRPTLRPGESAWAQLRLNAAVVARMGDRFILRTVGGEATIGGGEIFDAHPLKHRRHRREAALALEAIAAGDPASVVAHEIHKAARPLKASAIARRLGLSVQEVLEACGEKVRRVPTGNDAWLYDDELLARVRERVVEALARRHREKPLLASGLGLRELLAAAEPAGQLPEDVLAAMLGEMEAAGVVRRVGRTFALGSHRVEMDERQAEIRQAILESCQAQPFSPPTVADLQRSLPFPPDEVAAVHEALIQKGELVDGEFCGFHPEAIAAAWEKLQEHLRRHGQVTISEFRQLLGTTRRYALALAQHFDAEGRLVRDGDYRRLAET